FDVDRLPTIVVDDDRSPASRELAQRLLADGTLVSAGRAASAAEAGAELIGGRAAAAILIEEGYARRIARGMAHEPARVQVLVDGTNPTRSGVAASAATRFTQVLAAEASEA